MSEHTRQERGNQEKKDEDRRQKLKRQAGLLIPREIFENKSKATLYTAHTHHLVPAQNGKVPTSSLAVMHENF